MHDNTETQTEFNVGDLIMQQGDEGDCAYIIEDGAVEVYITHPDGSKQQLAIRNAGAIIGEMALVDRKRRTASVVALEPCKMIQITESDFKRRIETSDPIIKMVMKVILTRYRDTLSRIDSFGKGNYAASEEIEKRATSSGGKTVEHIKTGNEFKRAIANNELQLHYQPILDMKTMKVRGFEALMRWNHPERGFMPPNLFIPIAEDTGLIVAATDWVIREACNAIQRMKAVCPTLASDAFMSVNFTAQDMLEDSFLDKLKQVAIDTKINPEHVKLEMTERLLMNNPEKVRDMLNGCRDYGFKIAIDDFGTGYSSLSYLHHYPIDTLKIDRSFVVSMAKDESALNLVKGIITLAKSLKMDLVAEGIEEDIEEKLLIDNACDMAQGYKYSKPLPEDKLIEWLESR